MKDLYTTDELTKIARIARPTFNRYVKEGWVSPEEAGGGRGRQNKFSVVGVVWSMGLHETFNLWPDANAAVFLFDWELDGDGNPKGWYGPFKMRDGRRIQNYMRDFWVHTGEALAIRLLCGYHGAATTLTKKRFAEIYIGPMARTRTLLENWENRLVPYLFTVRRGKHMTIASVSVINLQQLLRRVNMGV